MTTAQGHYHDPLQIVVIKVNRADKHYRDALLSHDMLKMICAELKEAHGAKLCVRPDDADHVLAHLRQHGFVDDNTGNRLFLRDLHYSFLIVAAEYQAHVMNVLDGIPKRHRVGPKTVAVLWIPYKSCEKVELAVYASCRASLFLGLS